MSLSKNKQVGTIFMGPNTDRETTLERLYETTGKEMWTERTEEEYMERVRAKATERVRSLLVKARERGAEIVQQGHKEAEAIRAEAELILADANRSLEEARAVRADVQVQHDAGYQEGYREGHAEVMAQLAEARKELGETVGVVLLTIHEQCPAIFEAWRGQLTELFKEAVEKSTGLIVSEERRAMFGVLLEQSLRALLDRSHYTVKVNPEDAELLTEMLADAHQSSPGTANWELATDPALEPGSLVVESSLALVDNSRQARQSVVDDVLKHLSVPVGQADQDAYGQVTNALVGGLKKNGVSFETAGDEQVSAPPENQSDGQESPVPGEGFPVAPDLHAEEANQDFPLPDGMIPGEIAGNARPAQTATGESDDVPGMEGALDPATEHGMESGLTAPAEPAVEAALSAGTRESEPEVSQPAEVHEQLAQAEAQDMVDEFLGDVELPAPVTEAADDEGQSPGLPPELADELLADMGFGEEADAIAAE